MYKDSRTVTLTSLHWKENCSYLLKKINYVGKETEYRLTFSPQTHVDKR